MSFSRRLIKVQSAVKIQFILGRKSFPHFIRSFACLFAFCFSVFLVTYKYIQNNNDPLAITQNFIYIEPINSYFRRGHDFSKKIDYHDYAYIEREKTRLGLPGENGQPVYAADDEAELNKKLFDENGYYGLISDKIALNRSLPDFRQPECANIKYAEDLPSVSIVIPFYNDHLSTLLRTVYSVINRAPEHLLKEVILVNDHSTKEFLYDELEEHVKKNLPKVRVLVLPRRSGLIWARLAGARAATGDVLIFLDSHTEASTNYLPPLLEPIAKDYRTCVCPYVDKIKFDTFLYKPLTGKRGVFDWRLKYKRLPIRPDDQRNEWDIHPSPIMVGCAFAISARFFWELGGYDTGLDIWGGEQYELSLKVWLCGGQMFDVPCSRIGHIYKGSVPSSNDRTGIDFVTINYKRVVEVWFDSYKHIIYQREPEKFSEVDAGDLSYQFFIKERQHCKPFNYFLDFVAPDIIENFPLVDPPVFASGVISSVAHPELCFDTSHTLNRGSDVPIGMNLCGKNRTHPYDSQFFKLRFTRDIFLESKSRCLSCKEDSQPGNITLHHCNGEQTRQYFRYDVNTQQIFHRSVYHQRCIEIDAKTNSLYVSGCDQNSENQKFLFGFVNETAIHDWTSHGSKIIDKREVAELQRNN